MSEQKPTERPGHEGLTPVRKETEPYDATRDPRTGRPPNPLEAQRLAREREEEREASALSEQDETSETDSPAAGDSERPDLPGLQAPARMTSPSYDDEERSAADALVMEGVARERAEELIKEHGTDWEDLKATAFAGDRTETSDPRKEALVQHHEEGIPPFEPPERAVSN